MLNSVCVTRVNNAVLLLCVVLQGCSSAQQKPAAKEHNNKPELVIWFSQTQQSHNNRYERTDGSTKSNAGENTQIK